MNFFVCFENVKLLFSWLLFFRRLLSMHKTIIIANVIRMANATPTTSPTISPTALNKQKHAIKKFLNTTITMLCVLTKTSRMSRDKTRTFIADHDIESLSIRVVHAVRRNWNPVLTRVNRNAIHFKTKKN